MRIRAVYTIIREEAYHLENDWVVPRISRKPLPNLTGMKHVKLLPSHINAQASLDLDVSPGRGAEAAATRNLLFTNICAV
jgi:hypothetical protein